MTRLPTDLKTTNMVARAIHAGHSWADVAEALGAGERTVRGVYRDRIAGRIIRWVDPDGAADPAHGDVHRYWLMRRDEADRCYPDGRVCDPCLTAQADYKARCLTPPDLPTDDAAVAAVADRIHAGAAWEDLAAEAGAVTSHYRDVYRPLIQPRCVELAERDWPLPSHRSHGTKAAYVVHRCRCEPCRYSNVTYSRKVELKKRRGLEPYVDAGKARAHVLELTSLGFGWKRVADVAGVGRSTVWRLLYGRPSEGVAPSRRVRARTANRLLAVQFDLDVLADGALVDAGDTKAQLRLLRERGWTWRRIGDAVGQQGGNICRVLTVDRCTARVARNVRDVWRAEAAADERSRGAA